MAKIKAVLDQETWVAVDVPEEFQAIVLSLSSTDFPVNGMEMPSTDSNSKLSEDGISTAQEPSYSTENSVDNGNATSVTGHENRAESTSPQIENSVAGHVKSMSQTIVLGGVGYHMVNWLVIYIYHLIVQFKLLSFVKLAMLRTQIDEKEYCAFLLLSKFR
jgi:vacuolar protein sorting-associated protein 54